MERQKPSNNKTNRKRVELIPANQYLKFKNNRKVFEKVIDLNEDKTRVWNLLLSLDFSLFFITIKKQSYTFPKHTIA